MKTKNKSFKRLFAFLVALVMVTALVPSVIFAADPTFPDVPASHWSYDYIEKLAAKDVVGGYPDGTFGPRNNVTRQQAAKMIALAADLKLSPGYEADFSDMDKVGSSFVTFVNTVAENKVVGGYPDGSFKPLNNIKRSQAAKMIVLAFGLEKGSEEVKFDDPVSDATDQSYIDILASNGIVKGYEEGGKTLYKPYNNVTREQLAKMIVESMELEDPTFRVVDVRAINGVTIEVEFSKAVDADTVIGASSALVNIEIDEVGTANLISSYTAQLDLAGKVLTITPSSFLKGKYKVTVPFAVESEDGDAVVPYQAVLDFTDETAPALLSAKGAYGGTAEKATSLILTFSEPIASYDVAKIGTKSWTTAAVRNTITLTDGDGFTAGDVVEVINVKDAAGNNAARLTAVVEITEDKVAPTLVSVDQDTIVEEQINLVFSEKLNADNISVSYKVAPFTAVLSGTATVDPADPNGVTYNLALTTAYLTAATVPVNVSVEIAVGDATDLYGNANTVKLTDSAILTLDKTAPVAVISLDKDGNLVLTYNEVVTLEKALADINVTAPNGLLQKGDDVFSAIALGGQNKVVTLTAKTTGLQVGTYSITFPKGLVKDTSISKNESAEVKNNTTFVVTAAAAGRFDITVANTSTDNVIEVSFGKKVKASALEPAKYSLAGSTLTADDAKIEFNADQDKVMITLKDETVAESDSKAVFAIAQDAIIGLDDTTNKALTVTVAVVDNVSPTPVSFAATDLAEITVTFSEKMKLSADDTIASTEVALYKDVAGVSTAVSYTGSTVDAQGKLVLTLSDDDAINVNKVEFKVVSSPVLTDLAGNGLAKDATLAK